MRRTILQLAAVLTVILFSSPVDAQHCGCKLGRLFGGGGFGGAYGLSAGYGGGMDNCGRGITQSQAAALWSGYCTDSCSFDSSCGSFGGNSYAAPCATDNCNTGCASVGHSSGYVGGYAASSIVDDCYGDYSGGCFGGGHGGCKIKGLFRGLFGKLNGLGCGGGCGFGYGGGCGIGHGCGGGCGLGAGGGLLGRFGGGSGCFGGCFVRSSFCLTS